MLIQCTTVARVGQYLVEEGATFFAVAVYLRRNLTAERYVAQAELDVRVCHSVCCLFFYFSRRGQVNVAQKNFDLTQEKEAVAFFHEMYNLASELEDLAAKLNPNKRHCLGEVTGTTRPMISLAALARKHKLTTASTLASIPEGPSHGGAQDDLGVFAADDIQLLLHRMHYKISFVPVGVCALGVFYYSNTENACISQYPLLAVVVNMADDSQKGYLKFVKEGKKEIDILRYLTQINSPSNHTITGVGIWPVQGGNVISMPMAGSWITHLDDVDAHLWSVAKQLFEAVDFMHQHGVAHLDLKPPNIIIPMEGGRLSIIDFNRSVRITGIEKMFRGVVGTVGYLAPEVAAGQGLYSAVRADLWTCGKTLEELCLLCMPSKDRDVLLGIAIELMNDDPKQRPMMSDVLKKLEYCKVDGDAGSDYFWCVFSTVGNQLIN